MKRFLNKGQKKVSRTKKLD